MKNAELIAAYDSLDLKKLPLTMKKVGYIYRQVKRTNTKLLYSLHNRIGKLIGYEVFENAIRPWRSWKQALAKLNHDDTDYSQEQEWFEKYPSHAEFGKRAWSCATLKDAQNTFDEL